MQSVSDSSSSQSSLQSEHKSSHRHTRNLDEKQQFALEELKAALDGEELLDKARMTDAWLLRCVVYLRQTGCVMLTTLAFDSQVLESAEVECRTCKTDAPQC